MMDSRPARNDLLEWEKTETGEAQIKVIRQETWKTRLLSKIFYIPETRTITLDEVGTLVWQMCDGHTSVATMIERLREHYKLDRKEAEVSLLSYLKTLGQKRFVGFLVEGETSGKGRGSSGKRWKKKN
ncbi:MAG TPA: PqqD family protein [Candidatus Latescibacteria bacterium]|jgi:hypothetical protein|nr:PqqD family protein [Candidatus Latescibacterota bacterium]HJP34179.1 PqqD family protein [Candidatus Latescibacterota bacterium]